MSSFESDEEYLKSWSQELLASANRVRYLIGDRHWLTDGHHKEVIIRELLARFLPHSLTIGSGFIKNNINKTCSPEVDILITDNSKHPPYFNEGGIQIVPNTSVLGYIEVKSTFTKQVLSKAVSSVSKTQAVNYGQPSDEVWRCILFSTLDSDHDSFNKIVEEVITEHINKSTEDDFSFIVNSIPTCIASFDSHVVFLRADLDKNTVVLNCFEHGDMSSAVAFCDLFDFVRAAFGYIAPGELSKIVDDIQPINYTKIEIKI